MQLIPMGEYKHDQINIKKLKLSLGEYLCLKILPLKTGKIQQYSSMG